MGTKGKSYPRIHSISSVGIRNHVNINLLVHEMRTDFTGQSGSGKSLVGADIPQLILTAGRFYKSATKPKGNVSRDYNTLPLKDFGYCFMNIETKRHCYITIGVLIRRSPKQL
jgi:DNA repair protein SbcC/Rad50